MYKENPNEKILMTPNGKATVERELDEARSAYFELLKGRHAVPVHDTTTTSLGQANAERVILSRIQGLIDTLSRIELIPESTVTESAQDIVEIGDTLKVALSVNNAKLLKEFTLVDYLKQTDGDDKVSISSPLGSAIYHKQIGSTQSYQAPNGTISVEILEKKLPLEEEQTHGRV